MEDNSLLLIKRYKELADRCYRNNVYTCTSFLNMQEIDLFLRSGREFKHVPYELFGGRKDSERCVLRFGSEETLGYTESFPISVIKVQPLLAKFADELTHRDFLGALMNLGIERTTIGDICVNGCEAAIYCLDTIADFITLELTKVKHTNVKCSRLTCEEAIADGREQEYEEIGITVASERADIIAAKLLNKSRSDVLELFRLKLIFVNSRLLENNSALLKKGDIVSIRGYGKLIYDGAEYTNKKGKFCVRVRRYK